MKTEMKIGLGVGGLLLIIVVLRGGSSGASGGTNAGLTVTSLANAQAAGTQFASIFAQANAAADQQNTNRLEAVTALFATAGQTQILPTVQAINAQSNLAGLSIQSGTLITQSLIGSDLAKFLGSLGQQTTEFVTKDNNATSVLLAKEQANAEIMGAKYQKDIAADNAHNALLTNMSHDAQKTISSIYGH